MAFLGYIISDSAQLEVDFYELRAVIHHQLELTPQIIHRDQMLKSFQDKIESKFPQLRVFWMDAETGLEADEYDDELILGFSARDEYRVVTVQ